MVFEKKFQEFKDKFADADAKKLPRPFAMQVRMTDEDCGGIFYIAYIENILQVEPYDYVDHTSEIIGTSTELKKVFSGRIGLEKAVETGKVSVYGDMDDVRAVQTVLKKPAVKKPAEKKPVEKKAVAKKPEKKIKSK